MTFFFKKSKAAARFTRVISLTACLIMWSVTLSWATKCYHHYNHNAWHGKGMAIVFCLNSGGVKNPPGYSEPMAKCEARYHNTNKKISSWQQHGNLDNGRQAFTDYNTTGAAVNAPMDIVCTGKNGKTYTYWMSHSNKWGDPGVCPQGGGYIGGSACKDDHNPILTVTKSGTGKGSVKGNVAGDVTGSINCGSNCEQDVAHYHYYSKKKVTLTATAADGYRFLGWKGDCKGVGSCQLTMDSDKDVEALFGIGGVTSIVTTLLRPSFNVTSSVDVNLNSGTINPVGTTKVKQGSHMTYYLTPESGYGPSITDMVSDTTCPAPFFSGAKDTMFTVGPVTKKCSVVASFTPLPTYTVTGSVDNTDDYGNISPSKPVSLKKYSTASFTLTPDSSKYKATKVSGTCPKGTLTYGVPSANSSTYTTGPIKGNCTVVAHFTDSNVTVNSSVSGGNGTVNPSGSTVFEKGKTAKFTLSPSAGHKAKLESDSCGAGGAFSNNNTTYTTASLSDDCAVVFSFTPLEYTLSVSVIGDGGVHTGALDPSEDIFCYDDNPADDPEGCTHDYPYGTVVRLHAQENIFSGSSFIGWKNCTSPNGDECDVTIDKAKTVTAEFTDD